MVGLLASQLAEKDGAQRITSDQGDCLLLCAEPTGQFVALAVGPRNIGAAYSFPR